jgi:hypothetical protein
MALQITIYQHQLLWQMPPPVCAMCRRTVINMVNLNIWNTKKILDINKSRICDVAVWQIGLMVSHGMAFSVCIT